MESEKVKEVKKALEACMHTRVSSCANCWFCIDGRCTYTDTCTGSKKWSNILNSFVPTTYQEKTYLDWK